MQSNAIRTMWLTQLWEGLHKEFAFPTLPVDSLVVCGHPSKASRGSNERRRPAEVLVGEWRGNPEEKAFISVHPERFGSEEEVAKAILWAAGRAVYGPGGARRYGIRKTGKTLDYSHSLRGETAKKKVDGLLEGLGPMPSGTSVLEEPKRAKQTTRLRKWICPGCGLKVRMASDERGVELKHVPCNQLLVILAPSGQKGD